VNAAGFNDFLVSIGGEVRAKGRNGKGQPWTIAIEQPAPGQRAVERLVRLGDQCISTSGDYRNFFEQNGQRYSHIINPRTGRPVLQTVASVTMISDRSMSADATATALMAAGPEFGFRLATEHHLAAFFILIGPNGTFQERYTPEFEPYLMPQSP
jgi:thiamine biosynthesis lipoprotein